MEKVEETEQKRRKKLKKHSIGQRIVCGLLCICLSMASLPGFNYNLLVFAASGQEMQPEIVSFVDLPDEIKMQKVALGTSWEELKLPDTLTAVVSPIEREKNVTDCLEEHNVSSNMENVNTVTINNIEWTSISEYNSEKNSTYILTPILPQKYKLMEDIKLPEINIIVEEVEKLEAGNGEQKEQIEEENTVKAYTEEYTENKEENPDKEYATGNNVKDKENESKEENLKEAKQEETIENKNGKENQRKEKIENEEENTESKSGKENQRKEETENESIEGNETKENIEETERSNIEQGEIQKDNIDKNRVEEETEKTRTDKEIDKVKRDAFLRDNQQEMENSDNKEETEQTTMPMSETEPSCGTIQTDTTWTSGTLNDGELIIESGVTLTITGLLTIRGKVTIKGGGTILRGTSSAYFSVGSDADLTIGDIILEGNSISSNYSLIHISDGKLILDNGCHIQNCIKSNSGAIIANGGGAIWTNAGSIVLNNVIIENCSANSDGGAICVQGGSSKDCSITINGGIYRNNKTTSTTSQRSEWGGGFILNARKLFIYGGSFIGNSSVGKGGCIYHAAGSDTETYLYGGYFQGNKSSNSEYRQSGAIFHSSFSTEATILDLSGDVEFCGDGTDSGVDGIYLDMQSATPRKIQISNTLTYTVPLYLKATEGYVIANGTNNYTILHERDMKKISFVDVSDPDKKWYAVLDKEKNEVYLSTTDPKYGYYVYYISNGAQGSVTDDNTYNIGESAIVKGAEGKLEREGYHFLEWNTKADGTGTSYQEGEELEITGDINLYAIFEENEKKRFTASFYSGAANQKEIKTVSVDISDTSGIVTTPKLQEISGWEAIGWEADIAGYQGEIKENTEITLTEDVSYYGIYKKDVTLSYDANGGESVPENKTKVCLANVNQGIT